MTAARARLILWTGAKHSGKTTGVLKLAGAARAAGFQVAGVAAPSVYDAGRLVGFDLADLRTGKRESAAYYFRLVAKDFADTEWARRALAELAKIAPPAEAPAKAVNPTTAPADKAPPRKEAKK